MDLDFQSSVENLNLTEIIRLHVFSFWKFILWYFCSFYRSAVIRTKTFKSKQISVIKKIQLSRTNGRVLLLNGLAL